MSSKITHISSQSQLTRLLSSTNYVVVDFFADWCAPCKQIAPIFEALATTHTKPGKLAFVKVDVDSNQDIAKKFSVSAMPTFMVLKQESVVNSLRGADPSALRRMITDAAALADKSVSQSFSSTGHVLGSSEASKPATAKKTNAARAWPTGIRGGDDWYTMIIRFFMLYFTTLLSFDPTASAMASPYRKTD